MQNHASPHREIYTLLKGNQTLYGENPSHIAAMLQETLNVITTSGAEVISIGALPDYHTFGRDGGIKDIIILTARGVGSGCIWHTETLIEDDKTLHAQETDSIMGLLNERIQQISSEGRTVYHLVFLTDHHESAFLEGVGGYDGVKNVIICSIS